MFKIASQTFLGREVLGYARWEFLTPYHPWKEDANVVDAIDWRPVEEIRCCM